MKVEAYLPDGTILEFPEGTADAVVDRAVGNYLSQSRQSRPARETARANTRPASGFNSAPAPSASEISTSAAHRDIPVDEINAVGRRVDYNRRRRDLIATVERGRPEQTRALPAMGGVGVPGETDMDFAARRAAAARAQRELDATSADDPLGISHRLDSNEQRRFSALTMHMPSTDDPRRFPGLYRGNRRLDQREITDTIIAHINDPHVRDLPPDAAVAYLFGGQAQRAQIDRAQRGAFGDTAARDRGAIMRDTQQRAPLEGPFGNLTSPGDIDEVPALVDYSPEGRYIEQQRRVRREEARQRGDNIRALAARYDPQGRHRNLIENLARQFDEQRDPGTLFSNSLEGLGGQFVTGLSGVGESVGDLLGSDTISNMARTAATRGRQISAISNPGYAPDSLEYHLYNGINAVGQIGVTLVVGAATRNPAAVSAFLQSAQMYGDRYDQSRRDGRPVADSMLDATAYTVFEYIPERWSMGHIMARGGRFGSSFLGRVAKGSAVEAVQESATEMMQIAYDMDIIGEHMTWDQAWRRIKDSGIAGAIGGGTIAGAIHVGTGGHAGEQRREAIGEIAGTQFDPGQIDQAARDSFKPDQGGVPSNVTPEDIASPLPTDLISRGKARIDAAVNRTVRSQPSRPHSARPAPAEIGAATPFAAVREHIIANEAGPRVGGYDALAYNTSPTQNAAGVVPPRPITQMTIGEVYDFQRGPMRARTRGRRGTLPDGRVDPGSTGAGAYQFESGTLRQNAELTFGANWRNVPFSPQNQDRVAETLWNRVRGNPQLRANTWAAFGPNARSGGSVPDANVQMTATPEEQADTSWINAPIAQPESAAQPAPATETRLPEPETVDVAGQPATVQERFDLNGEPGVRLQLHDGTTVEDTIARLAARGIRISDGSRAMPIQVTNSADIEHAAARAAQPTDAQAEAGNYRAGHIRLHGIDITIETPRGAERSGTGPNGERWSVTMPDHYGYVKRSNGADGEQVDVYVGPHPEQNQAVAVIDQIDTETGQFDEHKAMIGYSSLPEARRAYEAAFSDGRGAERIGGVQLMSMDEFRDWLASPQQKPASSVPIERGGDVAVSATAEPSPVEQLPPRSDGTPRTNKDYRDQGRRAAEGGFSPDKNPYFPSSTANEQWAKGHTGAASSTPQQDALKAKMAGRRTETKAVVDLAVGDVVLTGGERLRVVRIDGNRPVLEDGTALGPKGPAKTVVRKAAEAEPIIENVPEFERALKAAQETFPQAPISQMHFARGWMAERGDAKARAELKGHNAEHLGAAKARAAQAETEKKPEPEAKREQTPEEKEFARQRAEYDKIKGEKSGSSDGGRILNTDLARELYAIYRADRSRSAEVHEDASAFIKKLYAAKLAEPVPEGLEKFVLFTGGGTGAGKSSGLHLIDRADKAGIVYDTNMNALDSAVKKIEQALTADWYVVIAYTWRDPIEALEKGALPRAKRMGRTVPLEVHLETHIGARRVVEQLAERYADNPRVEIHIIDNSHGKDNAREVSLENIPQIDHVGLDEKAESAVRAAYLAGDIGEPELRGTLGERARRVLAEGQSPGPRGGGRPGEKSEPEHGGQRPLAEGAAKVSPNTLFPDEAAERARAVLREKFKNISSNPVLDPELVQAGITLAGYHIEKGARTFAAYAKAMIGELGDTVRPYLRGWYEAIRHYPGMEEAAKEMSAPEEIGAALARLEMDAESATPDSETQNADNAATRNARNDDRAGDEGSGAGDVSGAGGERGTGDGAEGSGRPGDRDIRADDERNAVGSREGEPESQLSGDRAGVDGGTVGGGRSRARGGNRVRAKRTERGSNFLAPAGTLSREGGWHATADRNLDIIELVNRLDAEGRPATPEEQALLAKFTGWGAGEIRNRLFASHLIMRDRETGERSLSPSGWGDWKETTERAAKLLTGARLETALQSVQYAHFTSEPVIRSIWDGMTRLGFAGGKILEPGSGIGLFALAAPRDVMAGSSYTGIEMDAFSAKIGQYLLPQEHMLEADFIKQKLPDGFFDAAIGNPPFADIKVLDDPAYKKHRFSLHDYFFAKSIDKVRPGGLLVFVTSRYTMDKLNSKARDYIADRADLLGAIRLPQTAFKENAGTEVVTDVLFFQRRAPGGEPGGQAWRGTAMVKIGDEKIAINEYFKANPKMVLGRHATTGSMYRSNEYTVEPLEGDIAKHFAKAVARLPEHVYVDAVEKNVEAAQAKSWEADMRPASDKEGGLYLADGKLFVRDSGVGKPVSAFEKIKDADHVWLKDYVGLRDALKKAQQDQLKDADWEVSHKALVRAYTAFAKKHGPILAHTVHERKKIDDDGNETSTVHRRFKYERLLSLDIENPLVRSLEKITDDGEIVKGAFLLGRTLNKPTRPKIESVQDALAVSLDEIGRLDLNYIASIMGQTREQVVETLGDSIYQSPAGDWQTSDEYLSGDVLAKLEEAQTAAEADPIFGRNVDALLKVQPKPLSASDINVKLGAGWVPVDIVKKFVADVVGIGADTMVYEPTTAQWAMDGTGLRSGRNAAEEYGTADRSPQEILLAVLNNQTIKVTRTADKKTYTDPEATTAANEAAKKLSARFKEWVWEDGKRAGELLDLYNRKFNNLAPRRFDGSHLTFPGLSSKWNVHPHVKRAVWRVVQSGNTYLAHAVGAGKTLEMIISGMEQRRLGLIRKPMYVVPNHMLNQFAQEFLEAYPAAQIMVADEKAFHTDNRKRFMAQAALNDPDAIIVTHSSFGKLATKDESRAAIVQGMIEELENAMEESETRYTRSKIEKQIEALKRNFESKTGTGKDQALTFEDMGVDFVYVDEAHEFRKLDYATNRAVKGIDPDGSQRALDLYIKTRWLEQQKPGRSLVMASGTPVTNTMAEIYTVMRFMDEAALERDGLRAFDAWANMFGEVAEGYEQNAAGGYEIVERFAKFVNVPELMKRVRTFMDVLTSDQLGTLVKRPEINGGVPTSIVSPPIPALETYMKGELAERIKTTRAWKPSKDQPANPDPIIAINTDARLSSIDMRFINPRLPNDPGSKLNVMIDKIIETHKRVKGIAYVNPATGAKELIKGGGQIVFSAVGFGEGAMKNRGFDLRTWFDQRLMKEAGLRKSEIGWISDANTHAKKEALQKDVRSGKVKVLVGSPKNMGTGLNVQSRLIALHYLAPPWYPADVEQPQGRIVRQGNRNETVDLFWYATKGTYDSTAWNMVSRKAKFIEQALSGDDSVRSLDDISEANQYEMAAALAAGDERVIQVAGLSSEIERLSRLQGAHATEQSELRRQARFLTNDSIPHHKQEVADLEAAQKARDADAPFRVTVGGTVYEKQNEAGDALKAEMLRQIGDGHTIPTVKLGTFQGSHEVGMRPRERGSRGEMELTVKVGPVVIPFTTPTHDIEGMDAGGIAARLANAVARIPSALREAKASLTEAETELKKTDRKLSVPFTGGTELAEKTAERARLQAQMAAETAAAEGKTPAPQEVAPAPEEAAAVEEAPESVPNYQAWKAQGLVIGATAADPNAFAVGYANGRTGSRVAAMANGMPRAQRNSYYDGNDIGEKAKDDPALAAEYARLTGIPDTQVAETTSPRPVTEEDRQAIVAELRRVLTRMDPKNRFMFEAANGLLDVLPGAPQGAYLNRVAYIDLANSTNPVATLVHEIGGHGFYQIGLIRDAEWTALKKDAAARGYLDWAKKHYPTKPPAKQEEESVSEMIATFISKRDQTKGFVRTALQKIGDFVGAMVDALKAWQSGNPQSRQVMRAIERGEIGRRKDNRTKRSEGVSFQAGGALTFDDAATEKRWQEARKGVGTGASIIAQGKAAWANVAAGMTRHWKYLPNSARFVNVREQFRKLEAAPEFAKEETVRHLNSVVGKLTKNEYDLFTRKVVLDDLDFEAGREHQLPFGLTPATLAAERAKVDAAVAASPKIEEAIAKRLERNRKIGDEMVKEGILTEEQTSNPAYFRHMVLDYARAERQMARGAGSKVMSPWWAKRAGSSLDINANFLEAEADWMLKAMVDIETAKTIRHIKESNHNIREDLRTQARASNKQGVDEAIARSPDLATEEKEFRKRVAMGLDDVRKAVESGDLVVPAQFAAAAASLSTKGVRDESIFPLLSWIMENGKPGMRGAAMALKAISNRRAWARGILGNRYLDPENISQLVERLGPEGYVGWQPREGKHLLTAKTIPEHVIDRLVNKLADQSAFGISKDEMARALDSIRPQLVTGGDRYTMVIPKEIADTLDEFGDVHAEGMLAKIFGGVQSAWKRWVLINPRRFFKYNLNNQVGDLDAVIAGHPATMRKVPQAASELYQVMAKGGEPTASYREAQERGVFTSGLTLQEIPDINRLSSLKHLTTDMRSNRPDKLLARGVGKVWRALQDSTAFRESIFRYAAYLSLKEKMDAGQSLAKIGYGASVPKLIEAVDNNADRAALMARDLLGDYGAISVVGGWMRKYMIPFYSWMEINTRRYTRLFQNIYRTSREKGRGRGAAVGSVVFSHSAASLTIRMGMVYALIQLWNHLLFPDEEDDLNELQKRQLHLIVGRDSNGEVISLRTQGALSDFLNTFGFEDAMAAFRRASVGQGDYSDALGAVAKAPINRVATSVTPLLGEPIEQMLGLELWPDAFNPRPIRDRIRHLASTFSLENEYDAVADRPSRGYWRSWADSVVYRRDPGEMAYDDIRGVAADFLERTRGESGSVNRRSPKSDALRDYRQALRFGDQEAAQEALARYREFDGTRRGLQASMRAAAPEGMVPRRLRAQFRASLTPDQLENLHEAQEWFATQFLNNQHGP